MLVLVVIVKKSIREQKILVLRFLFSVVGIVDACLVVNSSHTKVSGWLMMIAGLKAAFKNTKA
jgi:hypothetical protein